MRGLGLVVLTGCGHGGAINIARHGFTWPAPGFEQIIEPTVDALAELSPGLVVPAHCTGWRAQIRFATALPDAFVPNAVGTSFVVAAA